MTQSQPGWYDDPHVTVGGPGGLRWWDGTTWTDHTRPAPTSAYSAPVDRTRTPDGEELAGWGRRLAAYLIDAVIVFVLGTLVGLPFMLRLVDYYLDIFRDAMDAAEAGRPAPRPPNQLEIYADLWLPMLGLAVVSLVVGLAYNACFLRWKQATPAKLMLGMRVRLRETPGPLTWGTILKRWLAQFGVQFLGAVPFLGYVTGFYPFLDGLWPLWDDKRQAVHDKVAATNVVRVR
jgi:uncharacterized RDD family membrane protein YckC